MQDLAAIAVRTLAVYVVLVVVLRLAGKRTIGNLTAFDLIVALMIGEVVDDIVFVEVPFVHGLAMIFTVSALHTLNSWVSFRSVRADRMLAGSPTVIVRDGAFERAGMRAERMNEQDVLGELRLQGVDCMADVARATVEVDGQVSVILTDAARPPRRDELSLDRSRRTSA